jgi:hypothetical protein
MRRFVVGDDRSQSTLFLSTFKEGLNSGGPLDFPRRLHAGGIFRPQSNAIPIRRALRQRT